MRRFSSLLLLTLALAPAPTLADDPAEPPAQAPADLYDQIDRKKIFLIKLPRSWKSLAGEGTDPEAQATFQGPLGADEKTGPQGQVRFYLEGGYSRATLARAMVLPLQGKVSPTSMRSGPGWAEGMSFQPDGNVPIWRRFVEKNGRVYVFFFGALNVAPDAIQPTIQKLLDTSVVTGDGTPAPVEGFTVRKVGNDFEVVSDAAEDREAVVKKIVALIADARGAARQALPGKPFDASKPAAWVFQNATKFETRGKTVNGTTPEFAIFNPRDRAAMVSVLGENRAGFEGAAWQAGAAQYVWQYFGGTPPIWLNSGLTMYGMRMTEGGGKGKLVPEALTKSKAAAAASKRRLDQWFDVSNWNDVVDNEQGNNELFAWQVFFRTGKGSKKYKKQFDGYLATLRESGDPVAARKAFDGVNFDEMAQEFKAWAADWK